MVFFFNDTATTEIYTLSLHDALPISPSFARIFYRNSFNMGLPIFESAEASEKINAGDKLEVNVSGGFISNLTRGEKYPFKVIPAFMMDLVTAGGLIPYLTKENAR